MPGHLEFEFRSASGRSTPPRRDRTAPFRILLCGDFSGRGHRGPDTPASLATRPVLRVDVDNLDTVLARLAPAVELAAGDASLPIAFTSIDAFHPDALFDRLGVFTRLRGLRQRLLVPASFEQASLELLGTGAESDTATMQRLLGAPAAAPHPSSTPSGLDGLLQKIVAPDIVPSIGPRQAQFVRAVDTAIAEQMRGVLHDPRFQALEAAWRSVHFLVTRLELDESLQLHLFDVTRAELDAAAAEPELERSGLWQALVERPGDAAAAGWAMVVMLEAFGPVAQDVSLLATLATVSAAAGAPCVASAAPDPTRWPTLDADSLQRWQALRRSPLAPWIALVAPRMLLRLPYGKGVDPLERFEFDEMAGAAPAQALLWGHASAACALLAGQAFSESGWQMALDQQLEVNDLPAWVSTEHGERRLTPCTEACLSERAALMLLDQGLMPLVSRRDRPAFRLTRWQSIAEPAVELAGPWTK